MAASQKQFFATSSDLRSLLRSVESKRPLQYVLTGLFDVPEIKKVESLADARDLGSVASGDPNHEAKYLVADRDTTIKIEIIPQRRGGVKYALDQRANPKTIAFQPAGRFEEGVLIAGHVSTISGDPDSSTLFRLFGNELQRQCSKVKSYYVGEEAEALLDRGWRLTSNAKSPTLYDLRRD